MNEGNLNFDVEGTKFNPYFNSLLKEGDYYVTILLYTQGQSCELELPKPKPKQSSDL